MDYNSIDDIIKAGFVGFKKMSELFVDSTSIPQIKGVYLVINPSRATPDFLEVGTGGHFKGKNPNVPIAELKANWVTDSLVVYIGKGGGSGSKATLNSRLNQLFKFGQGKNIGHWGGRLMWQLKKSSDLVVCWKPLHDEEPNEVKNELLKEFSKKYGTQPFANLTD